MKRTLIFLLAIFFTLNISAQGHKITIKLKDAPNHKIELAYYFGDKKLLETKGETDKSGKVTFEGKEPLHPGLYMLIDANKKQYFDFLIDDDQEFEIAGDVTKPTDNKAKGSEANKVFFDYQRFMTEENPKIQAEIKLRDSLRKSDPKGEELKKVEKKIAQLDEKISEYWKKVVAENSDLIIAPMLNAMNGPKPYQGRTGDYFFENIDFSKKFFLRTPIARETIMRVLAFNLNKKRPASDVIHECDRLLKKAEANEDVFQYTFGYILNFFNNFHRTGMNEVFVHLVENYVAKGKTPWFKPEHILEIQERAKVLRSNFVGETAFDLKMKNMEDEVVALHDVDAKYTIVYFWSVMCGHCKEATPLVKKLYDEIGDPSGLEVFAVCTDDRKKDWEKQILEKEVTDWINVIDIDKETDFRERYNVYSTPLLYLLDKDKKIVAKRLGPEQVKQLVEELMTQKGRFRP